MGRELATFFLVLRCWRVECTGQADKAEVKPLDFGVWVQQELQCDEKDLVEGVVVHELSEYVSSASLTSIQVFAVAAMVRVQHTK